MSENLKDWLVVVPARLASTRLPRKPLQDIAGKPLVTRVVENLAGLAAQGAKIVVATDSVEVLDVCKKAGHEALMTSSEHQSGTDRCWEVASQSPQKFILNVQGDEPFLNDRDLYKLMNEMQSSPKVDIGTMIFAQTNLAEFDDPHVVKVLVGKNMRALYFTRAPAPHCRDEKPKFFWQHVGVYAFTRDSLRTFCDLPMGTLERLEKLEQLRALENDMVVTVVEAISESHGIDTPQDLLDANERMA